jgi:hypothetical protein
MVRPVTVCPSLPKYTAREQASDTFGANRAVESSAEIAKVKRGLIFKSPSVHGSYGPKHRTGLLLAPGLLTLRIGILIAIPYATPEIIMQDRRHIASAVMPSNDGNTM